MKTGRTHLAPDAHQTETPCCGKHPRALPIGDRLSRDLRRVDCDGIHHLLTLSPS